ncbi:MAG: GNAT family protein [Pirellulales bacterium]
MSEIVNAFGQPIGPPLPDWSPAGTPPRTSLAGAHCRLEPLEPGRHAAPLFAALSAASDQRSWTYLPYGPFADLAAFQAWLERDTGGEDPQFFAIVEAASGQPAGLASYLRITPNVGTIEVGHLHYAPLLQRTPAATEAMYLLMGRAFGLGYRRYEWKCDALNAPSRAAAERLGFCFEGVFRQATIYKGRSRDTAWYSILDREWPALEQAFRRWLDPSNFDATGRQRLRLSELTAAASR